MAGDPLFEVPAYLTHLIPNYVAEMKADGDHLRALLSDRSELAHHAHAMGGKCGLFGDRHLAEQLYEIEALALSFPDDALSEGRLKALVAAVLDRLAATTAALTT